MDFSFSNLKTKIIKTKGNKMSVIFKMRLKKKSQEQMCKETFNI